MDVKLRMHKYSYSILGPVYMEGGCPGYPGYPANRVTLGGLTSHMH